MKTQTMARFEEGVSADPTENMSPEDAAKWKEMNEKHRDNFKTASSFKFEVHVGPVGVDQLVKKLKDNGIDAKAGTEKIYGTVNAEDKESAAEKINTAAGWKNKLIPDKDISKVFKTANSSPSTAVELAAIKALNEMAKIIHGRTYFLAKWFVADRFGFHWSGIARNEETEEFLLTVHFDPQVEQYQVDVKASYVADSYASKVVDKALLGPPFRTGVPEGQALTILSQVPSILVEALQAGSQSSAATQERVRVLNEGKKKLRDLLNSQMSRFGWEAEVIVSNSRNDNDDPILVGAVQISGMATPEVKALPAQEQNKVLRQNLAHARKMIQKAAASVREAHIVVLPKPGTFSAYLGEIRIEIHPLVGRRNFQSGFSGRGGDPYWMTAKFPGKAKDGTPIKKGDRVFYYPRTKTMLVGPEAEKAAKEFDAMSFDEDFGYRAAGFSVGLDKAWFAFVGNGPFNRDTMEDIRNIYDIPFIDDDGTLHDEGGSAPVVLRSMSSEPLSYAQEKAGMVREYVVLIEFAQGMDQRKLLQALQDVAKKYKLKVEALPGYREPKTRTTKPNSSPAPRGPQNPVHKLLSRLASLDAEIQASQAPGEDIEKDASSLEELSKLAHLDVVADQMIGRTILEQMGGSRRLMLMLGVKQFILLGDGVAFEWPNRESSKGNRVEIRLNGADLYDMTFFKVRTTKTKVAEYNDLYSEDLIRVFEKQTNWAIRLASGQTEVLTHVSALRGPDPKGRDWRNDPERGRWVWTNRKPFINFNVREQTGPGMMIYTLWVMTEEGVFRHIKPHQWKNKEDAFKAAAVEFPKWDDGFTFQDLTEHWSKESVISNTKEAGFGDSLVAEGCPDNLDASECEEWEANTEKYEDKFKTAAAPTVGKRISVQKEPYTIKKVLSDEWVIALSPNGSLVLCAFNGYTKKWDGLEWFKSSEMDKAVTRGGIRMSTPPYRDGIHTEDEKKKDDGEDGADKTAAVDVIDQMYALVSQDEVLGTTDDIVSANNKSFWRAYLTPESEPFIYTLSDVPLPLAQKLADVGTPAQTISGFAAWVAAKRYIKGPPRGLRLASDKTAGTGLYGHTKRVQADCEGCIGRVQRVATRIAKDAYSRNEQVAEFLSVHAKRANSLPAKILVAALQGLGPKVASQMDAASTRDARLAELRQAKLSPTAKTLLSKLGSASVAVKDIAPLDQHFANTLKDAEQLQKLGFAQFDGVQIAKVTDGDAQTGEGIKETTNKNAGRSYGLYGYAEKVSALGLKACAELRQEAGKLAHDLHSRREANYAEITSFLSNHSKEAKCMYSRLLSASYPEMKAA